MKNKKEISQIIMCRLGCINYRVKSTNDWCAAPGFIPLLIHEGARCIRGYTKSDMDKILEQERAEDEILRQKETNTYHPAI